MVKAGYKTGGVKFILSTCRTAFNWAARHRYLPPFAANPFSTFPIEKLRDRDAEDAVPALLLYDSGRHKLARRGKLEPVERQRNAQDEFDHWFKSAGGFYLDFKNALRRRDYSVAAFHLHQAVERYYHAVLLTCTGYKTKSHDIEKLGRMAGNLDAALFQVFPRDTDFERKCFELLKSAYIDARYKRSYKIGKRELTFLGERVEDLRILVRRFCRVKIAAFGAVRAKRIS